MWSFTFAIDVRRARTQKERSRRRRPAPASLDSLPDPSAVGRGLVAHLPKPGQRRTVMVETYGVHGAPERCAGRSRAPGAPSRGGVREDGARKGTRRAAECHAARGVRRRSGCSIAVGCVWRGCRSCFAGLSLMGRENKRRAGPSRECGPNAAPWGARTEQDDAHLLSTEGSTLRDELFARFAGAARLVAW
jgi:hypothetical protein